jgi:hypothetical protein
VRAASKRALVDGSPSRFYGLCNHGRSVVHAQQISYHSVQETNEPPDTQTIEGVLAEGTRMTTTYPVGFPGDNRQLTTATETSTSRDRNNGFDL